jgi:NADH-quinone oxidoreductase subunit M
MYEAIVALPLLGAVIAGAIALIGAHGRHPGGDPPPLDDHAASLVPEDEERGAPKPVAAHAEIDHPSLEEEQIGAPTVGSQAAELITTTLLGISWVLSCIAFVDVGLRGQDAHVTIFNFISSGNLKVDWALRIDPLTAVMLVVVTTISGLVHLYSIGYMADDPHKPRFFSYLSFFTFAMLLLVTADNLAQLFVGWEGVGLASYLLIGFWFHKPEANAAAIKAFIVNRVGDFGFALGIFATFLLTGAISFDTVFAQAPSLVGRTFHYLGFEADALTVICLLLFMGAMGKSAQFLLHTWLPDAMEGPTPVSALIHAATMVTAGVFMVARLSPLFALSPTASACVTFIGATTAFFAASVALVQNDIKRIIAYSTCSQLGYMFVAMGVGAYSIGMFHLFTHAFFKALLFLGAGSVIIAMHHEQDIRKMGGLWRKIPFTYATMVVGTLALSGFPFTAGFFSKDAIIEADDVVNGIVASYGFIATVAAAAFTAFYSWRLIIKTFHGPAHDAARGSGGRFDRIRLADARPVHRSRRRTLLSRLASVCPRERFAGEDGAPAARHLVAADGDDDRRVPGRVVLLCAPAGHSRRPGARSDRALPLPAQRLVFRSHLRCSAGASSDVDRPAVLERRRRLRDRRLRSRRRLRAGARCDPERGAPADRISLPLCLRHADRRGGVRHLVHVHERALMASWPILSVITFLPLAGALFIAFLSDDEAGARNARWTALWTTLITFAISLILVWRFDPTSPDFQFLERRPWLGGAINYSMGIDGISLPFVILTTALMPISIAASWSAIQRRVREYMVAFLVLETLMVGTFCALDLVLFYLFFEGGLIPMFLIIGVWGGPRRVYASFKFFLYTLLGSVLMLLAIMAMYWQAGTTDIPALLHHPFPRALQTWAFLAFLASFAVKLPMWPVHTWLPDAHVEAPTAGSVILAAILLKLGGYGFLRFSLPMFPQASQDMAPLIYALSVVAIVYTSLVALMQEDMKKLIAYSSVAHMGFVTMGLFALTAESVAGGIFQMISHGVVSAALFLCVGVVYDRMHTREIAAYGGLVNRMPIYAFVFMVFTLANVGLPGTSGFIGEFLTLIGTFGVNNWVATLATLGTILSAAYALWLYRKVIFGRLTKPGLFHIKDVGWREIVVLAPLVVLTIVFGVHPNFVLDISAVSVSQLIDDFHHAVGGVQAAGLIR